MDEKSLHWADQTADRVIHQKGDKELYTCASGITPSGIVHIGNFREIMTVELVVRALKNKGKNVRFIYSWDDFDVFRKVPVNMPKQEVLKEELRKPITEVPDTFDCHESYARHNELPIEEVLPALGINVEFLYQDKKYKECIYAEQIKIAIEKKDIVAEILNQFRKEPVATDWLPVEIFCELCRRDTITKKEYRGNYQLYYECKCGHADEFDFRKSGIVKLKWRTDWPMRWMFEGVDYEPGGKDHSAAGGSRSTGEIIVQKVYNFQPPVYQMYEFISLKGVQEFSSSEGVATTVQDVLAIYEPIIVRWLFAGSRPSAPFAISFDLDVIKIYEDFDRCERIYYGIDTTNEKNYAQQKRIYELSAIEKPYPSMPFQPGFRHLTNVLLCHQGDMKKVHTFFASLIKTENDLERLMIRAQCAWNWLQQYAPEDFKYSINTQVPSISISSELKSAFHALAILLLTKNWTDKELHEKFYEICTAQSVESKQFFEVAYQVLIGKTKGPQLASFILTIGKEKVAELFTQV